jgi:phospholipid N-methyltransferase
MDERYLIRLINILRPLPWVREWTQIAIGVELITIVAALADATIKSREQFRMLRELFWRETATDTVLWLALLTGCWFLLVTVHAASRIYRYWRADLTRLRFDVMWVLYPWVGLTVVPFTITGLILARRAGALPAVALPPVVGFEVGVLMLLQVPHVTHGFSPVMEPKVLWKLIKRSLALALGPGADNQLVSYARDVVDFAGTYALVEWPVDGPPTLYMTYTDARTLAVFQSTLSCLFETADFVGDEITRHLAAGRPWSMIDVGGGEGVFTSNAVLRCATPPSRLNLVEPDADNVRAYRQWIQSRLPGLTPSTDTRTIELAMSELQSADIILASHSLYSIGDNKKEQIANVLAELRKRAHLRLIVVMASRESAAYKIKKSVLQYLGLPDISTFAENLLAGLEDVAAPCDISPHDSVIDVSSLLYDDNRLIAWLAYFCRVQPAAISQHLDAFRTLLDQNASPLTALPLPIRRDLEERQVVSRMSLNEESRLIFHKELVISIAGSQV